MSPAYRGEIPYNQKELRPSARRTYEKNQFASDAAKFKYMFITSACGKDTYTIAFLLTERVLASRPWSRKRS